SPLVVPVRGATTCTAGAALIPRERPPHTVPVRVIWKARPSIRALTGPFADEHVVIGDGPLHECAREAVGAVIALCSATAADAVGCRAPGPIGGMEPDREALVEIGRKDRAIAAAPAPHGTATCNRRMGSTMRRHHPS